MPAVSLKKIFANDHKAFLLAAVGPVAMGISIFMGFMGGGETKSGGETQKVDPKFAMIALLVSVIITIASLVVLWLRLSHIKQILFKGPRATATLLEVKEEQDGTRVGFEYELKGRRHKSTAKLFKSKAIEGYQPGHQVEVAVDPKNPKVAYIVELYSE